MFFRFVNTNLQNPLYFLSEKWYDIVGSFENLIFARKNFKNSNKTEEKSHGYQTY